MDQSEMKNVVKTLESDYVWVTEPDKEEVSSLVLKAKGDGRTMKEFAEATGISAPTLSRIVTGKMNKPLSLEAIVAIVNQSESNTLKTMVQLARACGYVSRSQHKLMKETVKLNSTRNEVYIQVKKNMFAIIIAELFTRGLTAAPENFDYDEGQLLIVTEKTMNYDFAFETNGENENYTWIFFSFPQSTEDFKISNMSSENIARNILRDLSTVFLTDAWTPEQYKGFKISFCFVDKEIYNHFCYLVSNGVLNNRFSAILLDLDKSTLIEEKNFESNKMTDSVFDRKKVMAINFADEDILSENGDSNYKFVSEEDS